MTNEFVVLWKEAVVAEFEQAMKAQRESRGTALTFL
jgi:hypothetical protein